MCVVVGGEGVQGGGEGTGAITAEVHRRVGFREEIIR